MDQPRHQIAAYRPRAVERPLIHDDEDIVAPFLSDAAHVPGGVAAGVAFPASVAEASVLVAGAARVLPVGARSSLTGGATPRGELVLSTRRLQAIGEPAAGRVHVGAGVTIAELQDRLAAHGLYYPPAPTYEGATMGGTIATNAAGPATFKYGATRDWVEAITVVLADGDALTLTRGEVTTSGARVFELVRSDGSRVLVPLPQYSVPEVPKLSAGYAGSGDSLDPVDLFIGSEGTLGIIVDATVRVIARPRRCIVLTACRDEAAAVALTTVLREDARSAWQGRAGLDVSAIEYIDARALGLAPADAFRRAGVERPPPGCTLLIIQVELQGSGDTAFDRLQHVLDAGGIEGEPRVALPEDERGARALLGLREAVPAAVNAAVAAAQASIHPEIEKTAGDMIVPFTQLADSLALYREAFERRNLQYAVWGHLSDGNLHPNVIPRSLEDVRLGREAILEIGRGVLAMGGAPLAEHGVGRNPIKQQLLRELYGEAGIAQMRAVKRALDPQWKLAPGVLFDGP